MAKPKRKAPPIKPLTIATTIERHKLLTIDAAVQETTVSKIINKLVDAYIKKNDLESKYPDVNKLKQQLQ